MISVQGLRKTAGGRAIVDGVDLEVAAGEVVAIIGPSGGGKSSLLRCIGGLEPFAAGRVRFRGVELSGDPRATSANWAGPRQIRGAIGMVFQQFHLFPHMTALENVIEAPLRVLKMDRDSAIVKARELLARVNMSAREDCYPASLSGGEQQRVAIARALAMQPECVLFDEPTSALDPEMAGGVLQILRGLAKTGMTMLIATHEMEFAREIAGRVVVLDQGAIIESGAPGEVFDHPCQERTRLFLRRVMRRAE